MIGQFVKIKSHITLNPFFSSIKRMAYSIDAYHNHTLNAYSIINCNSYYLQRQMSTAYRFRSSVSRHILLEASNIVCAYAVLCLLHDIRVCTVCRFAWFMQFSGRFAPLALINAYNTPVRLHTCRFFFHL